MNCKLYQFLITKAKKQGISMKSKMLLECIGVSFTTEDAKGGCTCENKSKQNNKIPGMCKSDQRQDDGFLED